MSQLFSHVQYQDAIKRLELGQQQLVPDGKPCAICTNVNHYAFQCALNPLKALALCQTTGPEAQERFESSTPLRFMASWDHKKKAMTDGHRFASPVPHGFIDPNNGD